jgi:hypothetical protein
MKLKIKSFKNITINLIWHFPKVNLVLENRLNTGRVNTMKSKESMLTSKVNLTKRKLFGKISLSSIRNKRSKPKKIKKRTYFNSNKLLTNSRRHRMNPRASITQIIRQFWGNSKKSLKLKWVKLLKTLQIKLELSKAH